VILVVPLLPPELALAEYLKDYDKEWQAVAALFAAILVSSLLYNLNTPLVRFYEGYLFEDSWLGCKMRQRHVEKLTQMNEEIERLRKRYERLQPGDAGYSEVGRKLGLTWAERRVRFPSSEEFVTPTVLGNVIAAFEHYAYAQYGMDSVILWPRLVSKFDAAYAGVIDDAKTSLDFFVNSSFLLAVVAVEYSYASLYARTCFSSVSAAFGFLGIVVVLGALSWLAYRSAVDSAIGWGNLVKAAFDLYRWDLLAELGYEGKLTNADETDLWRQISQGMTYWGPDAPLPPYRKPTQAATKVEPSDIEWSVTKGVEEPACPPAQATGPTVITYVLTVQNVTDKDVQSATLSDTVPLGFDYIAGSAELGKNGQFDKVETVGTNPYCWKLGCVHAGQRITLTYKVISHPGADKMSG